MKVWTGKSVSVVVLPSGTDGEALLALAKQWTSSWLIGPAFWVTSEQIPEDVGLISETTAFFVGRDKNGNADHREVSLRWALGAEEFKMIRLVAVRTTQDFAVQAETTKKVHQIAEWLDSGAPAVSGLTHEGYLGTAVKKINLIFTLTNESRAIPQSVVETGWDANVLASPEDRPTPSSFDAFVQRDFRYFGFVLSHIACAAGLWVGLNKSTYEITETVPNRSQIRMQRVFIRAVATDKLSGELARYALDQASSPDNEKVLGRISGKEVSALEKSLVPQKIHELVAHLMRGTAEENFIFKPWEDNLFRQENEPKGFRNILGRSLDKITRRITDFVEGLKHIPSYLAQSVNSSFDSDASEILSREHLPLRLRATFGPFTEDDISFKDMPAVNPSSSTLWEHVRQTFSSSVDSPPTYPVPSPLNPKTKDRLVLGDMRNVAPDPDDIWEEIELSAAAAVQVDAVKWLDVEGHAEQKEILDLKEAELAPGITEAQQELSESKELHRKSLEEEKAAEIELQRAQDELAQDLDFASEIREDHTHNLPPRISGPTRPPLIDEDGNQFGESSELDNDNQETGEDEQS